MGHHSGHKPHILCAFRSSRLRQELTRRLRKSGYDSFAVSSSIELVDAVAQERYDVLLLDSKLGGGDDDGIELLQALRASAEGADEMPVVIFPLGAPSPELARRARAHGARVFSDRKLRTRTLAALIEQVLGRAAPSEGELLSLCDRLQAPNPFAALGLARSAQPSEIRRAYEELHRSLRPAARKGMSPELRRVVERAFDDLESVFAKLTDPEELEAYHEDPERDEKRARESQQEAQNQQAEQLYRKGSGHIERREWSDALQSFQSAVELSPEHGVYRASLGWAVYLVHGAEPNALREAIGHARAGMKLAPGDFRPALTLGRLYQFTNRLDLAMKALKRAVRLNPDSLEAVRELRILRMRDERKPETGLLSRLLRR